MEFEWSAVAILSVLPGLKHWCCGCSVLPGLKRWCCGCSVLPGLKRWCCGCSVLPGLKRWCCGCSVLPGLKRWCCGCSVLPGLKRWCCGCSVLPGLKCWCCVCTLLPFYLSFQDWSADAVAPLSYQDWSADAVSALCCHFICPSRTEVLMLWLLYPSRTEVLHQHFSPGRIEEPQHQRFSVATFRDWSADLHSVSISSILLGLKWWWCCEGFLLTIFLFFSQDSNEVVVLRAFSDAVFRHKLLAPNLGSILVQFMMQNMAKMFTVPRSLREKISVKLYQIKTGQNVPDFGESLCCFNWLSFWIVFLWTFVLVWGRDVAESLQHQVHLAAEAGSTPQCSNDFFSFSESIFSADSLTVTLTVFVQTQCAVACLDISVLVKESQVLAAIPLFGHVKSYHVPGPPLKTECSCLFSAAWEFQMVTYMPFVRNLVYYLHKNRHAEKDITHFYFAGQCILFLITYFLGCICFADATHWAFSGYRSNLMHAGCPPFS